MKPTFTVRRRSIRLRPAVMLRLVGTMSALSAAAMLGSTSVHATAPDGAGSTPLPRSHLSKPLGLDDSLERTLAWVKDTVQHAYPAETVAVREAGATVRHFNMQSFTNAGCALKWEIEVNEEHRRDRSDTTKAVYVAEYQLPLEDVERVGVARRGEESLRLGAGRFAVLLVTRQPLVQRRTLSGDHVIDTNMKNHAAFEFFENAEAPDLVAGALHHAAELCRGSRLPES